MTEQELIDLGFKKKKVPGSYWYEMRIGRKHKFITNDVYGIGMDAKWFVGYDMIQFAFNDTFWFNNGVKTVEDFLFVKRIITGK